MAFAGFGQFLAQFTDREGWAGDTIQSELRDATMAKHEPKQFLRCRGSG